MKDNLIVSKSQRPYNPSHCSHKAISQLPLLQAGEKDSPWKYVGAWVPAPEPHSGSATAPQCRVLPVIRKHCFISSELGNTSMWLSVHVWLHTLICFATLLKNKKHCGCLSYYVIWLIHCDHKSPVPVQCSCNLPSAIQFLSSVCGRMNWMKLNLVTTMASMTLSLCLQNLRAGWETKGTHRGMSCCSRRQAVYRISVPRRLPARFFLTQALSRPQLPNACALERFLCRPRAATES